MTAHETFLYLVTADGWLSLHQRFHQTDDETFLYLKTAHEMFPYLVAESLLDCLFPLCITDGVSPLLKGDGLSTGFTLLPA